ncbi:hypothetical protein TNCV_2126881 [Trichonephila clavipes]|nr:hypothetical protein TNCV_2126881 [Trichonephila clavipes]
MILKGSFTSNIIIWNAFLRFLHTENLWAPAGIEHITLGLQSEHATPKVLCGVMNLPTPSLRFNKNESVLDTAAETVATVSMEIAAKEAKDVSGHSDITAAIVGTWQTQGIRL